MSGPDKFRVFGESLCWREVGVAGDRSCPQLAEVIHCRNCSVYTLTGRTLFEREATPGLARKTAEMLAKPLDAAPGETVSLLLFRLGREHFAIKTTLFEEVTAPLTPHRLPFRRNPVLLGLVNVNGELLPCVSAAEALGAEVAAPQSRQARMVVIGKSASRFAFMVDEALAIRHVPTAEFRQPPSTVVNSPGAKTSSVFQIGGKEFALVDEEQLFETLSRSLNS